MNECRFLDELDQIAIIYIKKVIGLVSKCEEMKYKIFLKTSCIKEELLIRAIKDRAIQIILEEDGGSK